MPNCWDRPFSWTLSLSLLLSGTFCLPRLEAEEPEYQPEIAPASAEAKQAISSFRSPDGSQIELVAAEPLLANPVAFCFDEQGRIFVCETFRQQKGVEDNRSHTYWLMDDLRAETVADRRAYIMKYHAEDLANYTTEHDRLRLLTDTDQNGVYDQATVFADGFNDIVDGTGAGVLAVDGDVYYTCIPKLWKFRDSDGDGVADQSEVLHEGFGVRFAFRGHDMHGLTLGPDGRIYFSIGDRGYHVQTPEGQLYHRPETGAVFRCERDGSQLEVFAYGLRNPQELAFDDQGNLFTGDNNSDSGDKARWVHVCEGGDSGWRMYFQYLADRGPWNRERMWYPYRADEETTQKQPAYIVPPVANVSDGPSGLVAYYGVGLPERYAGHFFLADFRGQAANSGIRSFGNKPHGASFELVDSHEYLWKTLATDVDFGYDGLLYYSDWVSGWNGLGKGRIYRSVPQEASLKAAGQEVAELFRQGFQDRSTEKLIAFLDHADRRVRQRAQGELARRKASPELTSVAENAEASTTSRLHAIWGLWEIGRALQDVNASNLLQPLVKLLQANEAEVAAQAAQVLGDCRYVPAQAALIQSLQHDSPRVRYFAALGVGKLQATDAVEPLLNVLVENNDQDPVLRHAAVMGLVGIGQREWTQSQQLDLLLAQANHSSRPARLGILLALRRLSHPGIARFLRDGDPALVLEAARAIHDEPIMNAMPELALWSGSWQQSPELIRRVMDANFLLGEARNAEVVVNLAANDQLSEALRLEALEELLQWENPPQLDRVTNAYRAIDPREAPFLKGLVEASLGKLMVSNEKIQTKVVELAAQQGIDEVLPVLQEILLDEKKEDSLRVAALYAWSRLDQQPEKLAETLQVLLKSKNPQLRLAATNVQVGAQPLQSFDLLKRALREWTTEEKQNALEWLGEMDHPEAQSILLSWMKKLIAGEVEPSLELDLLNASLKNSNAEIQQAIQTFDQQRNAEDPLAQFHECLEGGDAMRGRDIFFGNPVASCQRCHAVNGQGGGVGPELSEVAKQNERPYLLESIVFPNAKIAKGFDTVLVVTIDGKIISGIVKEETEETLTLVQPLGDQVRIAQDDIEDRAAGKSGMPADFGTQLTKSQIRDLVAYLASLKEKQSSSAHGESHE